nr:hypothetical protein RKE32_00040 [Streptomyces sp. Li-HN-5-13]
MPDRTQPLNLGEQLLEQFLTAGRTLDPRDAPRFAEQYTRALGLGSAAVYLADIQQHRLVALAQGPDLPIDGTLAGWTFRTGSMRVAEDTGAGLVAWFPLTDGAERLGVLGLRTPALDREAVRRCGCWPRCSPW